jgi:subtilisin family serine protease
MKKAIYLMMFTALLVSCKREQFQEQAMQSGEVLRQKATTVAVPDGDLFSKEVVDNYVLRTLEDRHDFRWEWADWKMQCSAIQYGDKTVAIGYRTLASKNIEAELHQINLNSAPWKAVREALQQFILDELQKSTGNEVKWEDILVEDDPVLPIFTLRLPDASVLTALYNLENVRYIEPLDYWPGTQAERSSSGCSGSTYTINSVDYTSTTPGCLIPWNFTSVGIPTAWNTAQGQGITIGVIDAGISSAQSLLGSAFNSGSSNVGRTITTGYTFGSSAYTTCSHGTSMCGLAAGPRNSSGATTGVAYKSNLHFIRGCEDVMLDLSSEKTAVKNALVAMGNHATVRIVSMSIGTPFYSSVLYDGVVYAYNKGKMIFAAAGTSYDWLSWWGVVYPAVHPQCIAITGVKENSATCDDCHDGSEVDFTVPMERNTNASRNSLSLPQSGTWPTYIGGSSCATATAAGIAALVWSARPTATRSQVFNYLLTTSQYYPSVTSSRGYGNLNAAAAVNAAVVAN